MTAIPEPPKMPAFIDGEQVMLRPLRDQDINETYLGWLNDAEVTRFLESGTFPETPQSLRAFYDHVSTSKTDAMFAIVEKATNRHIGNIKLGSINWVHRYGDLGIMIGDKGSWHKGYGREACELLLKYAFEALNLEHVILGVYANHTAAIRAYEKAGFTEQGRLRNLLNFEGEYVDKVWLSISKATYTERMHSEG